MTPTEAKDFLTSLSPDKGQAQQYRLLTPGVDLWQEGDEYLMIKNGTWSHNNWVVLTDYKPDNMPLLPTEFGRRKLESREVPDLKEKVKAAILEAMRSAEAHENFMCMADETDVYAGDYGAWCDLCAPEEVKP